MPVIVILKTIPGKIALLLLLGVWIFTGCNTSARPETIEITPGKPIIAENAIPSPADAATILGRIQVPILCYHQLRDFRISDSKSARDYIVPVKAFREQIKLLADSGYHTIIPDQLYDWLVYGKPLPSKPVMISFDDTRLEQYEIALPELNKYEFKAVFFIMTVSLGRPGYMSTEQVTQLAGAGHTIGLHTWNHKNVKTYSEEDWVIQVDKPIKKLESITGQRVNYMAYPFGLWNENAIFKIKQRGLKAAFQLSDRRNENDPLYTIRRLIVPGEWNTNRLYTYMKKSF